MKTIAYYGFHVNLASRELEDFWMKENKALLEKYSLSYCSVHSLVYAYKSEKEEGHILQDLTSTTSHERLVSYAKEARVLVSPGWTLVYKYIDRVVVEKGPDAPKSFAKLRGYPKTKEGTRQDLLKKIKDKMR